MRVAIVHYHMGPGGVPRVIAASSRILSQAGIPHVILAGPSRAAPDGDLPIREVSGLEYDDGETPSADPGWLVSAMRSAAHAALGGPPDLWHFHNHSLGKNRTMAEAAATLAAAGERLLLQIHDLAEDGRPENRPLLAACANPYPTGPRILYAFLNSRDRQRFIHAGLTGDRAVLLENPPAVPATWSIPPDGPPLLLYPVRGIRRKNLGELALLTALAPAGCRAAITQAPPDGRWRPIHDHWQGFCADLELPLEFGVVGRLAPAEGAAATFESWVAHATHFVTTSVAEGFGMVRCEAMAWCKPLIGRELAHLERISPGDFYQKILIPGGWVDRGTLDARLEDAIVETYALWDRLQPANVVEAIRTAMDHAGHLDFGNLPEQIQQMVIHDLVKGDPQRIHEVGVWVDHGEGASAVPAAAWLEAALTGNRVQPRPAADGRDSRDWFQKRLLEIYQALMNLHVVGAVECGASGGLDPGRILDACLTPDQFHFLSAPGPELLPGAGMAVMESFRAVVFDVYGTLRIAPAGGVKPDPGADPMLRQVLSGFVEKVPDFPSFALHDAVQRRHAASSEEFPEIDLRECWREVLGLADEFGMEDLVLAVEAAWHPSSWMPGAVEVIRQLHGRGIALGLLSNAQCDLLPSLGGGGRLFAPDLTILSYRHGMAKPSADLFERLAAALARRGIHPGETLFIGNDPLADIAPAGRVGFKTAWFTGHPASLRAGHCRPDYLIRSW
jgi:FMN phosphatase YigB (HAD superfamily)